MKYKKHQLGLAYLIDTTKAAEHFNGLLLYMGLHFAQTSFTIKGDEMPICLSYKKLDS